MTTPDLDALAALAHAWMAADDLFGHELAGPLAALADAPAVAAAARNALAERFDGELAFGTAGVRAEMGAGKLRLNRLTIRRLTTGVALHLLEAYGAGALVVVGHDARQHSRTFAEETAQVLAAHGLRVRLAEGISPTPVIAWALLHFRAHAGIVVTASHNPPRDNGYKVYARNGAQLIPPDDFAIAHQIAALPPIVPVTGAARPELIEPLSYPDVAGYDHAVAALPPTHHGGLRLAYTPMHGVGGAWITRILGSAGFEVHVEPEQAKPDGTFPTVTFPNPEEPGAMDRVLALGHALQADLVVANDPDADRLAIAIPSPFAGGFAQLTGDEVGVLLADYLLANTSGQRMVATTIVSSQMLGVLASQYGVDYRETLTGFKWIANAALAWERQTGGAFVFGYEEALGYTIGNAVRDKDGVAAALVFAELAAWNRAQGRTVADHLADLRGRTGVFVTQQVSKAFKGQAGQAAMNELLAGLRASPPRDIAGLEVISASDLQAPHTHTTTAPGELAMPASNVLIYRLADGHRVIVRPSGTEPKLKIYFEARAAAATPAASLATARATLERLAAGFLTSN